MIGWYAPKQSLVELRAISNETLFRRDWLQPLRSFLTPVAGRLKGGCSQDWLPHYAASELGSDGHPRSPSGDAGAAFLAGRQL